jgi:hypothetical protein
MATQAIPATDAKAITQEGFIFGLPLVYIGIQDDVLTNVPKPEGGRAPFNQFDHHRNFPDARNNKIVGMNVDTLYSLSYLNLTEEPMVLIVPPMEGKEGGNAVAKSVTVRGKGFSAGRRFRSPRKRS